MLVQLDDGGIRLLLDQVTQTGQVDLDDRHTSHRSGLGLAGLVSPLFEASSPSGAYLKDGGDLLGFHAAVVGRQHTISQFLRVGSGHPWLLLSG
jgi:hypothetical protein